MSVALSQACWLVRLRNKTQSGSDFKLPKVLLTALFLHTVSAKTCSTDTTRNDRSSLSCVAATVASILIVVTMSHGSTLQSAKCPLDQY